MTIHLPEDLERSIISEVHGGYFATVDDAIAEAWRIFLLQQGRGRSRGAITPDDINRQMLADGLLSELPDDARDIDDDDEPVEIEGELLSETIIRERR